jgi:hypothetical protein
MTNHSIPTNTTNPTRRQVLHGIGAALSLPWLESLSPRAVPKSAPAKPPVRLAWLYVPNGVNSWKWFLEKEGTDVPLSPTMEPLTELRQHVLFTSGLTLDPARGYGDGGGQHARATAGYLTCTHALKNHGKEPRVGVSCDQLAAQVIGSQTRLSSLEIGCERPNPAGDCDAGYSGIYRSCISWRTPSSPLPSEINPRIAFLRLFADSGQGTSAVRTARETMVRKSVLDLVLGDAKRLQPVLGGEDRHKLDEYLDSVRSVEERVQASERNPAPPAPDGTPTPRGIPADFQVHIRLMMDLLVLAFQSDSTRLITLMLANEGSGKTFPELGLLTSHHWFGHHEKKPEKLEIIHKVDRWYVSQFAYLVKRLADIKEGQGSLLDSCGLVYGCALRDGNLHDSGDLPILVAGRAGGAITTGRSVIWPKETPLANLHVSLLQAAGISDAKVGDSTGPLARLAQ